jgi:hypothetical protein
MRRNSFRIRHGARHFCLFGSQQPGPVEIFSSNHNVCGGARSYLPRLLALPKHYPLEMVLGGTVYGQRHGTRYRIGKLQAA